MSAVLVWTGRLSCGVPVISGRIHNLVDSSRVPCHAILLLYKIKNFSLLYDTLKPALHNILMETKEVWASTGISCARMNALEIHERSKLPVFVDCSVFLSIKCITRGWVAG